MLLAVVVVVCRFEAKFPGRIVANLRKRRKPGSSPVTYIFSRLVRLEPGPGLSPKSLPRLS